MKQGTKPAIFKFRQFCDGITFSFVVFVIISDIEKCVRLKSQSEKLEAPTPQAPIRNSKTRKVTKFITAIQT